MKYNIDAIIVVEGKTDVSYLSSFINSYFFITNGYDLSQEKLEFLKNASNRRKIIILTDPDKAGEDIRNKLINEISGCFVIEISGKSRKNYKKHGVAEANTSEIVSMLQPFYTKTFKLVNFNLNKYFIDHLYGETFKQLLIYKYRLISGTTKSLENQLNMLKVTPREIETLWKANKDGHR